MPDCEKAENLNQSMFEDVDAGRTKEGAVNPLVNDMQYA